MIFIFLLRLDFLTYISYNINRWFVFIIVFALTEVFKMHLSKLNRIDHNQRQDLLNADITKLQEQFNTWINRKDFPVDKILLSLKEIKNLSDLQKAINQEVNKKLSSEEIIKWEPIKFLFLTEKNIIRILNIMSTSKQKLDETKSKMIYPNIKKILLKNDNDATNLIKYIQKEQIMYFDNKLLEQIPIDNIKKFTFEQIDCLNPEQFEILLGRKDCSEYICNNIGFRELPAHQTNIISKLPYEKIAELTEDEINSLHQDSVKIILKRSYDVSKIFQTSKQFNALSDDKELTEKEKDLRQNLRETVLIELYNFQKTLQTSDKFQQLRSLIPPIVNTDLQKMKNQNATTQQIIENLDYLIYHIGQEQIKDLDDYVLTNLPKELILKFNSQQVKNFSSAQCLTLLKREDCSDYIINNLTAEQIYNMDLKNIWTLPRDTIKKFVTKHQKFLFVNDINDYLNNLGIDYGDKNNPESRATQYSEEYSQKCQQFNTFRYNTMLLIENLLVENDFTDLILPMLKSYHFSKLSKETLKKLINSGKLDLQKQNISAYTLKKWFDNQIRIYPSKKVREEWICDRLQDLTAENYNLALKLIYQYMKSPNFNKPKNKLFIVQYMITLRKKEIIGQIQNLNKNFAPHQQRDQIKTELKKLISENNLQRYGQEIAQNLSTDLIKLLAIDKIELLIQYGALKYFPDDKISAFDIQEISKLSIVSIVELIKLAMETNKQYDPDKYKTINKFFDTYIPYFTPEQLKSLFKNGDNFLLPEAIQKIKPETLFSNNEDDRKNILWKIDVMKLNFSKFKDPFYKNNFLAVDVCKKFFPEQIEQLLQSEKIKYLDPKFLVGLSDKQIETFNTNHLNEKQILALIDNNKFRCLSPEIINNANFKNCVSEINSSVNFSEEQQKKLIDNDIALELTDKALENFNSDLIVKKLNTTTDKKFMQNELLTKNLAEKNKIQNLNPDVIKEFTVKQIKILSQSENLNLTDEQIDILLQKNYIHYFNANFVKSKLTKEQVKKIKSIVQNQDYAALSRPDKTCITIDQLVWLSNTDKFCYISTEALDPANSKSLTLERRQKLNLENATAEQINILFKNNDFSEDQIGQLLQHQEFAKINSDIIKKIGTNITINQWKILNFKNMSPNQLEDFFIGCKNNMNLKNKDLNQPFNDSQSIDDVIQSQAFQEFYLYHVANNNNTNINKLDDIILLGKKSAFAKDKIFLRIVQHKLSISENQTNASQTNNSQKPIDPHMRKAYKKFIETLDNEDIKKFDLTNADKSLVDLLSIEKLLSLDDSVIKSSKPIRNKLAAKKDNIERWINFLNHVPLIGWIYQKFKSPLLASINNKLPQLPESRESNPELQEIPKETDKTIPDNSDQGLLQTTGELNDRKEKQTEL